MPSLCLSLSLTPALFVSAPVYISVLVFPSPSLYLCI